MKSSSVTVADERSMERSSSREMNAFERMAELSGEVLEASDRRRDAIGNEKGSGSSATNWIDEESSSTLQELMKKVVISMPEERRGSDREEALQWMRWFRSSPTPLLVDLSKEFRQGLGERPEMLLERLGCRLLLLPSGSQLHQPLMEPTGAIIFSKLLYGGVSRFRLLPSSTSSHPPRRAGERTATSSDEDPSSLAWVQYGGPQRTYEAIDMGPAAVVEIILLPYGKTMPSLCHEIPSRDMVLSTLNWSPQKMFGLADKDNGGSSQGGLLEGAAAMSLSGQSRNEAFRSDFQSSVGGLQPQIDAIVRRVLDGRVLKPADDTSIPGSSSSTHGAFRDVTEQQLALAAMEAEELELLGLTPVKGLLLYGPPGCGKTALAREISKALRARAPKIVSAPELLDRWVGGSEKLVRALFVEAEAELAACSGDARQSALHVIVIDEIDAVFRQRSMAEDTGEATRSSAVNQILAKLDGVQALPNVLLIGMTNRRELIDQALLRPGRLEVQIHIPLPDQHGRRQILNIHFQPLRQRGRLSQPLCHAIDGTHPQHPQPTSTSPTTTTSTTATTGTNGKRERFQQSMKKLWRTVGDTYNKNNAYTKNSNGFDLAADSVTGGFSGADIAGLVRCAGSIALSRARTQGQGVDALLVTLEDVQQALQEVQK